MTSINVLIMTIKRIINAIYRRLLKVDFIRNIIYKRFTSKYTYRIKDSFDTVDLIINQKVSVARYGDGELDMIWGVGNGFQSYDRNLAKRLNEILISNNDRLVIGVPHTLISCDEYVDEAQLYAKLYVCMNYKRILSTIPINKEFINTNFSRFYMSMKDKSNCGLMIKKICKIWENKSVLLVEGTSTRFGVGNNLLSNVISVRRILCPSVNAFSKYDIILNSIKNIATNDDIIILALGMTATVLAADLALLGYHAIDIGHLDVEYEWYLMQSHEKCALKNKAVNEVGIQVVNEDIDDIDYVKSIICRID